MPMDFFNVRRLKNRAERAAERLEIQGLSPKTSMRASSAKKKPRTKKDDGGLDAYYGNAYKVK